MRRSGQRRSRPWRPSSNRCAPTAGLWAPRPPDPRRRSRGGPAAARLLLLLRRRRQRRAHQGRRCRGGRAAPGRWSGRRAHPSSCSCGGSSSRSSTRSTSASRPSTTNASTPSSETSTATATVHAPTRLRRCTARLTALSGPCRGGCPVGDADHETASWKFPKHAYTDLGTPPHFKRMCQPTVRLPAHGPERGVRQL